MNTSTANTGSSRTTLGRLLAAALILGSVGAQAGIIPSQGTWTTTLQGRDASGNPVALLNGAGNAPNPGMKYVYDTVLDLTWLANWNAAAGSSFDNGSHTSDGRMTWANAKSWSAGLTDFGGGWVLPSVLDIGDDGCNQANSGTDCGYNVYGSEAGRAAGSPLAHMYYDTLGNKGLVNASGGFQPDFGLKNTGPFSNMQSWVYWSGTAYVPSPVVDAWYFGTVGGSQNFISQVNEHFAVAVRRGDVFAASVPEPEGLALLGLAFGMLSVVRRRVR